MIEVMIGGPVPQPDAGIVHQLRLQPLPYPFQFITCQVLLSLNNVHCELLLGSLNEP